MVKDSNVNAEHPTMIPNMLHVCFIVLTGWRTWALLQYNAIKFEDSQKQYIIFIFASSFVLYASFFDDFLFASKLGWAFHIEGKNASLIIWHIMWSMCKSLFLSTNICRHNFFKFILYICYSPSFIWIRLVNIYNWINLTFLNWSAVEIFNGSLNCYKCISISHTYQSKISYLLDRLQIP